MNCVSLATKVKRLCACVHCTVYGSAAYRRMWLTCVVDRHTGMGRGATHMSMRPDRAICSSARGGALGGAYGEFSPRETGKDTTASGSAERGLTKCPFRDFENRRARAIAAMLVRQRHTGCAQRGCEAGDFVWLLASDCVLAHG